MRVWISVLSMASVSHSFSMKKQVTLSKYQYITAPSMKLDFMYERKTGQQKQKYLSQNEDYIDEEIRCVDGLKYINRDLFHKICQNLIFLPVLSILSGLSPAAKIVAQSHISQMPDCPIAHNVDTLLLWPAVMDDRGVVSSTIFQAPVAAVTDVSLYDVDWVSVQSAYFGAVLQSLLYSFVLVASLYSYLNSSSRNDDSKPKVL